MYKTAIARIEGEASYDEAFESFRVAYPEYEIRGIKQASDGWLAFIQKNAYQDQNEQDAIPAPSEIEFTSPGADEDSEVGEPDTEYEEEEEKQEDLMSQLEEAISKVEDLVAQIKGSEETEEEVRPDFGPEDEEEDLLDEGPEMDLEREKEDGLTLASATKEIEELLESDSSFSGYRLASVSETETSYIAKLKK